jgi:hypothetical protein
MLKDFTYSFCLLYSYHVTSPLSADKDDRRVSLPMFPTPLLEARFRPITTFTDMMPSYMYGYVQSQANEVVI